MLQTPSSKQGRASFEWQNILQAKVLCEVNGITASIPCRLILVPVPYTALRDEGLFSTS